MAGDFIDAPGPTPAPAGQFIDAPGPAPGKSFLQKAGDVASGAYRGLQGARTAAARDPVGALANVIGAPEGAVAGAVAAPLRLKGGARKDLGQVLQSTLHGALGGLTNPQERDQYNQEFGNMIFGEPSKNPGMPERIGRGAENFALQTMIDPVTHGGAKAMSGLLHGGSAVGGAAARTVKPLGKYATAVREAVNDPALKPAVGKVAHTMRTLTAPIRGGVNAGKDLLFLNPLPHGLGNMSALNFLANGPGTTAKGLWYGLRGAPKGSVEALKEMEAGAWTPELLGEPSPWGPVGWASALGKKGVPAVARAGVGGAAGGAIGAKTAPTTDTPQQRTARTAEGALLGALTGASPEVLNTSNRLMSRLETGHRAAMLESLPAAAKVAPKAAAAPRNLEQTVVHLVQSGEIPIDAQQKIFSYLKAHPKLTQPQKDKYLTAVLQQIGKLPEAPARSGADPRAAAINAAFGGGPKGPIASLASALGGPFAQWQAEVVPAAVGSALKHAPARVEAFARGQDIANRDVLKDKPYKLQVGGPVGGAAEMVFNAPKYASRLLGPLGGVDPGQATNPQTFNLADQLKGTAYNATPGREVVGPFFGDTMYPQKAPAIPSAALATALGWHFSNRTPATDAILQIMAKTGMDRKAAESLYYKMRR
jgi:hypothetical protein